MKWLIIIGAMLLTLPPVLAQTPSQTAEARLLSGQHPAGYYKRAIVVFQTGRKEDGVFLFYLGQLRYRTHLAARGRELKPDADPALFASLSEVVGRPVNEWAFGDLAQLGLIIDGVLAYDEAYPDTFTSPMQYPQPHASIRAGLARMKAQVLAGADDIRAQRRKNGLENRN